MRVAIKTLGCRQNQHESDALGEALRLAGHRPAAPGEAPDLYIVNTCTVTGEADADSRQAVRRAVRNHPSALVVVTGCYAQVAAREIASIGGVHLVAGNAEKARLPDLIRGLDRRGPPLIAVSDIQRTRTFEPLPPAIATSRSRAFLKVQDGCNYRCTFCIIPETRGPNRSRPLDATLDDLRALLTAGFPEVVLTGIHLGTYGRDLPSRRSIAELLQEALEVARPARIRLSSLDPHEVGEEIIALFARFDNLCRHLHLPLQSGDDRILKLMRRAHRADDFRRLVERLADAVPGIAIGTDVIVGFPGEGEDEFVRTYRLLEHVPVAYLHVFPYSRRHGTVAASMPDQVPASVKADRSYALRALSMAKWTAFREAHVGHSLTAVVLDKRDVPDGRLEALTDNYITVAFDADRASVGRTVRITIEAARGQQTLARLDGRRAVACAGGPAPADEHATPEVSASGPLPRDEGRVGRPLGGVAMIGYPATSRRDMR